MLRFSNLLVGLFVIGLAACGTPRQSDKVAAQEDTQAPDFVLPTVFGELVSLAEARKEGPVLLVFYRGHW